MEPQQLQTTEQQMEHPGLPEQSLEHQQEQQPEQQLEHQPEQQQPEQQEQTHFQLTQLQHHQLQHSQQQQQQQQQQFQQQAFQQSPQHFQPLQPAPPPPQQQQQQQQQQDDCSILSPTLADILSEDRILRFYQCVKDIKTQDSPKQTAAMFFALCHALGDTVSFLKVPNMSKIMFRQEQQIFAVNVAGTQQETVQIYQNQDPQQQQQQQQQQQEASLHAASNNVLDPYKGIAAAAAAAAAAANTAAGLMHDVDSTHSSNLFAATAADGSPQHLLQAALASVTSQVTGHPQTLPSQPPTTTVATNTTTTTPTTSKRRGNNENKDGTTTKRSKKASPRDKEYAVRRNEIIQDLLKVSEADLLHQANIVDSEVKLIIQGHERTTKFGMLAPLHRFAAFANLPAHYDCDFAPKNAGVYYNYEYFQLYLAYRDLEAERQQQQQMEGGDPRSILSQCRADIEKVLVSTNWEAIRRRLTIGERICQVCGIVGRGFLLLSKQVSGRKLLHNFNTGEWGEFMREFEKQENQPLLQTLQTKYNPERFYGPRQEIMVVPATTTATATNSTELHLSAENIVKNETIDTNTPPVSHSESSTTATPTINEDTTTPTTATATATTPTTTNTATLN
ncbi:MAG: hypothetical protein EXX96DRAFT_509643 [Benjaminiella poitrasii]|nr:MAG: hypothetical protein EXX96DRAFT_509643 [Benjaminiella poitrasii]